MFIQLTLKHGETFWINMNSVRCFYEDENGSMLIPIALKESDDSSSIYIVKETPEEIIQIMQKIKEAEYGRTR